jgi:hypothetical protein
MDTGGRASGGGTQAEPRHQSIKRAVNQGCNLIVYALSDFEHIFAIFRGEPFRVTDSHSPRLSMLAAFGAMLVSVPFYDAGGFAATVAATVVAIGRSTRKVVAPASLLASMVPPRVFTMRFTKASPNPVPPCFQGSLLGIR